MNDKDMIEISVERSEKGLLQALHRLVVAFGYENVRYEMDNVKCALNDRKKHEEHLAAAARIKEDQIALGVWDEGE